MVITDMNMPRMTGTDLAREMLSPRPDLSIRLCTGDSDRVSEAVTPPSLEKSGQLGYQESFAPASQRSSIEFLRGSQPDRPGGEGTRAIVRSARQLPAERTASRLSWLSSFSASDASGF